MNDDFLIGTGCYRNIPNSYPGAVSVSVSSPKWWGSPIAYRALAPVGFHRSGLQTYLPKYDALLAALDPREVVNDLRALVFNHAVRLGMDEESASKVQPVILCWEKPGDFCHRRLVASWLKKHLDLVVPEVKFDKASQSLELVTPPAKAAKEAEPKAVQQSLF